MSNKSRLPVGIARRLGASARKSNQEVIIDYLTSEEGAVELNEQQQALLERWSAADDLIRANKYRTNQVVKLLCKKFDIGPATARRDLEAAKTVFGSSRRSNKNYLLALHIDRIQDAILQAQQSGRLDQLPKLFDCYTNAVKQLPPDEQEQVRPTAIIFQISQTNIAQLQQQVISQEEAEAIVEDVFKQKGLPLPTEDDDDNLEKYDD